MSSCRFKGRYRSRFGQCPKKGCCFLQHALNHVLVYFLNVWWRKWAVRLTWIYQENVVESSSKLNCSRIIWRGDEGVRVCWWYRWLAGYSADWLHYFVNKIMAPKKRVRSTCQCLLVERDLEQPSQPFCKGRNEREKKTDNVTQRVLRRRNCCKWKPS